MNSEIDSFKNIMIRCKGLPLFVSTNVGKEDGIMEWMEVWIKKIGGGALQNCAVLWCLCSCLSISDHIGQYQN